MSTITNHHCISYQMYQVCQSKNRRLAGWLLACSVGFVASVAAAADPAPAAQRPVRVVVWDEQQPQQKPAYDNFLGNAIGDYLKSRPGFTVRSMNLSDPEQGVSDEVLDGCDVLVWWGHVRNRDVPPATGKRIVERIKAGRLSMVTLHSAHWSTPFVEAMFERTRDDVLKRIPEAKRAQTKISYVYPKLYTVPKRDDPLTPSVTR